MITCVLYLVTSDWDLSEKAVFSCLALPLAKIKALSFTVTVEIQDF